MDPEFQHRLSMMFDDVDEGPPEEEKPILIQSQIAGSRATPASPVNATAKPCKQKIQDEELGCCSFRRRRLIVEANPFLAEFFRRFYEKTKLGVRSKIFKE